MGSEWMTPEFKKENITDVTEKLTDHTAIALWFAGTATTSHYPQFEKDIHKALKNNQQMSVPVADAGNILGSGIATAAIIAGQYYWDENQSHWKSHARAFVWENIIVESLKHIFGKQRPGNKNAYVSMPSGHTATAFATATSLTYAYGWKAGLISYPLAALVGASRMADDMHWLSDVVAGAFVGVIIGRATYSEQQNTNTQFVPVLSHDYLGVVYNYKF